MNSRIRWFLVIAVSAVALSSTAVVGTIAWQQYHNAENAPSEAETAAAENWATGNRVAFRNTALGRGYGLVASVPLDDPSGPRSVTEFPCDRVDATAATFSCLRSERGVTPSYTATLYSNDGTSLEEWPLPGIPSRTRISADGRLVATTAFVTGHTYGTMGFSTATVIHTNGGEDFGNFEGWTLVIDGASNVRLDRNFWGVTFIDDTSFYATAGITGTGKTYLVRGDIPTRTLTSVAEGVECPSLSPDGSRIAFKRVTSGSGATVHWTPAIMDLATRSVEVLPEPRNVDDQIEWLDDSTILYGMPRDGQAGDTDVWSLDASGAGRPQMFIEHAWSPSVVRQEDSEPVRALLPSRLSTSSDVIAAPTELARTPRGLAWRDGRIS